MCEATCSESGQLLTIKPCGWYLALQSDRDRLAGVVAGMEDQNARNLDALRWAEDANAELRQGKVELHALWIKQVEENARLREALENIYCLCAEGPDALGGSLLALAAVETEAGKALKEVG